MDVNPFAASRGFCELESMRELLEMVDTDNDHDDLVVQHKNLAKEILIKTIKEICSEIIPSAQEGTSDEDEESEEPHDRIAALRRKKVLANRAKHGITSTAMASGDPVKACVDQFFDQQFDIRNALVQQESMKDVKLPPGTLDKIGPTDEQWMANWETVSLNFDVLHWWVHVGRELYPLIFPVALLILSVPDSNGKQERTFSAASWMDGKLSKRQSGMTFQSKVLLYKNKGFLEKYQDIIKKAYTKESEKKTRELLRLSSAIREAAVLEEDDELLMDAFDGFDSDDEE